MKFTNLDKAKQDPLQVKILDLEGEWLETADLVAFSNLTLLRLSNCDFVLSAGVKISGLEDLLIVNHAAKTHKQISYLPLVFSDLLSLHLEYVKNSLDIEEHIGEFKKLQKLIINQGELEDISFVKALPKTLNYLDLGANNLKEIPAAIGKLKNLEVLRAPANFIEKISPNLSQLSKLRVLQLGSNKLSHLPKLAKSENLFHVELSNNQFKNLPRFLLKGRQLHELYISNNPLQKLPKEICEMPRLRLLIASACKLKSLPRNFGRLQSLRSLHLSENLLQTCPQSIFEIKNLEWLKLNNNQIRKLPKEVKNLQALRRLDLEGNRLMTLPKSLYELTDLARGKLPSLYRIHLERNQFQHLPRILMTMNNIEIKGVPGKKFLEGYREACINLHIRSKLTHLAAYDYMTGKKGFKVSIQTLAELTQINLPALQRIAQKELVKKLRKEVSSYKFEQQKKFYLVGGELSDYQAILPNEFEIVEEIIDADVFVVCKITTQKELNFLSENPDKLVTEREFLRQLLKINLPYLLLPENKESADSLAELFQSKEEENKLIAISAMAAGGVPQELKAPLICLAIKWRKDNNFLQIRHLCELYFTDKELDVAEYFWGFWLNQYSTPQGSSKHKLKELCTATNFNYDYFYAYYVDWKKRSDLPF